MIQSAKGKSARNQLIVKSLLANQIRLQVKIIDWSNSSEAVARFLAIVWQCFDNIWAISFMAIFGQYLLWQYLGIIFYGNILVNIFYGNILATFSLM